MDSSYFRARARQILSGKWGLAILVTFVASIFGATLTAYTVSFEFEVNLDAENFFSVYEQFRPFLLTIISASSVMGIAQFVLSGVLKLGYCRFLLKLHDGEDAEFSDLFSGFDRFGDAFVLSLLQGIYVFLWSLLLIIPGIIAMYRYAMAFFILQETPGMRASEALDASKQMMDGNKASLFGLQLSFIGWALLNMLTLGIGSLWLNPYANVAQTAFYRSLRPRAYPQPEPGFYPGPGTYTSAE